jgi:hypothetical protein
MPRHYFDIREGDYFSADEEGVELPSLQAAQQKAAWGPVVGLRVKVKGPTLARRQVDGAAVFRALTNIASFWSSTGTVAA